MKSISKLILLLCLLPFATGRKLGHHSSKAVKHEPSSNRGSNTAATGGKSGKSGERIVSIESASKSSKPKDDGNSDASTVSKELHASSTHGGGKSGKATVTHDEVQDIMSVSMSTMDIENGSEDSVWYTNGKAEKGSVEYSHSKSRSDGSKSGKAVVSVGGKSVKIDPGMSDAQVLGGKAEKLLTNFFIKTSSDRTDNSLMGGKSGKGTHIKTIHSETVTVTYENAHDIDRIKAKSSKAGNGYSIAASKANKPSGSSAKGQDEASNASTGSSKAYKVGGPTSSSGIITGSSKSAKDSYTSSSAFPTITPGSSASPTVATTTESTSDNQQSYSGEQPEDNVVLLTLAPTPTVGMRLSDLIPTSSPKAKKHIPSTETPTSSTYEPTSYEEEHSTFELSNGGETFVAINPFALSLHSNSPSPRVNIETIRMVTMEHLVHSFRNDYSFNGYIVNRLKLMLLDPDGERRLQSFDQYELFFGGILYFETEASVPSTEDIDSVVKASFTGSRLDYYVNLLQEAGMDIGSASFDEEIVQSRIDSTPDQKWKVVSVGLAGAVGGIALLATGVHVLYKRKHMSLMDDMNDIERGGFVIKLKDDADVEEFPGMNTCNSTVANTENDMSTMDDRSIPSNVGQDVPSLSSTSLDAIEQETIDPRISPLEDPPTRYVSVFTVKKDVKGKTLDEIDLRALVIAYLSKMLRKFPNTFLLPHDKESESPPITSIRNIPDDLEQLEHYVGNARVDEDSGKVMFNLRVESDQPVSKMKKGGKKAARSSGSLDAGTDKEDNADAESKGFEDVTI